jgi:hypothetical protein
MIRALCTLYFQYPTRSPKARSSRRFSSGYHVPSGEPKSVENFCRGMPCSFHGAGPLHNRAAEEENFKLALAMRNCVPALPSSLESRREKRGCPEPGQTPLHSPAHNVPRPSRCSFFRTCAKKSGSPSMSGCAFCNSLTLLSRQALALFSPCRPLCATHACSGPTMMYSLCPVTKSIVLHRLLSHTKMQRLCRFLCYIQFDRENSYKVCLSFPNLAMYCLTLHPSASVPHILNSLEWVYHSVIVIDPSLCFLK